VSCIEPGTKTNMHDDKKLRALVVVWDHWMRHDLALRKDIFAQRRLDVVSSFVMTRLLFHNLESYCERRLPANDTPTRTLIHNIANDLYARNASLYLCQKCLNHVVRIWDVRDACVALSCVSDTCFYFSVMCFWYICSIFLTMKMFFKINRKYLLDTSHLSFSIFSKTYLKK